MSNNPFDEILGRRSSSSANSTRRQPSSDALSFPQARAGRNPFDDDNVQGGDDDDKKPLPIQTSAAIPPPLPTNPRPPSSTNLLSNPSTTQSKTQTSPIRDPLSDAPQTQVYPTVPVSPISTTTTKQPVQIPTLPEQQTQPHEAGSSSSSVGRSRTLEQPNEQTLGMINRMADNLNRFMASKTSLQSVAASFKRSAVDAETIPNTVLKLTEDENSPGDTQHADIQMEEFEFIEQGDNWLDHISTTVPLSPAASSSTASLLPPRSQSSSDAITTKQNKRQANESDAGDTSGLLDLQARVAEQQGMMDSLILENQMLRRKLAKLRESQLHIQSPKETVDLIIKQEAFMLDHIRSFNDKLEMLDYAVQTSDTFAIIEVTLFLIRSLKRSRFISVMKTRPVAVDTIVAYWRRRFEFDRVSELLLELDRKRDHALFEWWRCYRVQSPAERLSAFEKCLGQLRAEPSLATELLVLVEQIELLKLQMRIEAIDAEFEKQDPSFLKFPRRPLLFQTTMGSLAYCAMYHFEAPPDAQSSPQAFKQVFKIGEKAYTHTLLQMRAKLRDWDSLRKLLTVTTSLFFQPTTKSCIGFEPFVRETIRNHAPYQVVAFYLRNISDPWRRYQVAADIKAHDISVEALIELRHRSELIKYIMSPEMSLPSNLQAKQMAEAALKDYKIKWKTFKS